MLKFLFEYKRKIDRSSKTHPKINSDILKDINTTVV